MVKEATEANLVRRILEGIEGGYYPNAYSLYEKLPKAFKHEYSYWDILKLFHEMEWNVKVIEIARTRESSAWNPWMGEASIQKNIIEYSLRPEFSGWAYKAGLFEKILENLHQEPSHKIDFDLTLK